MKGLICGLSRDQNRETILLTEEKKVVQVGDNCGANKADMTDKHPYPPKDDNPPPYNVAGGYPQQTYGYPYPPSQAYAAPPGYTPVGQHMPQGGVVLAQPGVVPTQVVVANVIASPPPDHMIFNIFMTLFCCWPIGIFAIIKSMACRDAINRGDATQAIRLSKEARRLGYCTLGIGILTVAVSIIMLVIMYAIVIPNISGGINNHH